MKKEILEGIYKIGVIPAILVVVGLILYMVTKSTIVLSILLILVGVVTYSSIMSLSGTFEEEEVTKARIRLAITTSLFFVYLTYLGIAAFWTESFKMPGLDPELFKSITNLLAIVIPFYFGAEAVNYYIKTTYKKNNGGDS